MTVSLPLRQAVYDRAEGQCDCCGIALPLDEASPHHRKLKSQGGRDSLPNLLCLCADSHRVVHANPAASYRNGWMVPNGQQPGGWPVLRWDGWHLPDRDGWRSVPSPAVAS